MQKTRLYITKCEGHKRLLHVALVCLFFCACSPRTFTVSKKRFTYCKNDRYYIDTEKLNKKRARSATIRICSDDSFYIAKDEALRPKSGWRIRGQGQTLLIKEASVTAPAISIENAWNTRIEALNISTEGVVERTALGLITINNPALDIGIVELYDVSLSGHYKGLWVNQGRMITVENCEFNGNGQGMEINAFNTSIRVINSRFIGNNVNGIFVYLIETENSDTESSGELNVIIENNQILKNENNGIRIKDSLKLAYNGNLKIIGNRIDSNFYYGIECELPARIENNCLKENGLAPDKMEGYAGLYVHSVTRTDSLHVTGNTIIDQAPIKGINSVYLMNLNIVAAPVLLKDNTLIFTEKYTKTYPTQTYGVYVQDVKHIKSREEVLDHNTFEGEFTDTLIYKK